ncbi:hypothetical protein [Alcanivorax sp.]|uniref:hypothetical protein n=1 Tax=Alcanivorax sp. TaxID=1872427 RepID=UPI000C650B27|nr:hypothetical protein [Alcanivorax sp.]MBQ26086.1 hypothetical protein [Alcanivorax sp.]|tara:strand:- start:1949 stop:2902 length:954 start_codon:yes stop_codon:yes gene_type:complete
MNWIFFILILFSLVAFKRSRYWNAFLANFGLPLLISVSIVFLFLTSSLAGVFLLTISLYALLFFFDYEVMSLGELLIYISKLDAGIIASIISSLVTVLGFFIAFSTGRKSWEIQKKTEFSIEVSESLSVIVNDLVDGIINLNIYYSGVIDACSSLEENPHGKQSLSKLRYICRRNDEASAHAKRIQERNSQLISFIGTYTQVFESKIGVSKFLEFIQNRASVASLASHYFVPTIDHANKDSEAVAIFFHFINQEEIQRNKDLLEPLVEEISSAHGYIRGMFLSTIFKSNLRTLWSFIRRYKKISPFFIGLIEKVKKQ